MPSFFFPLIISQLHALEESSGKPLSTEPSRPTTNVDPRLLEDEDVGSPSSSGVNLKNSQQPCNILQQPVHQVTTKPFGSNTAVTTQNKAALQQQKVQQNLSALTSKPGQNVVLLGFPQGLPSDTFKQPLPPQQRAPSKPRSVHLLSQGSSSSSATQHVAQAMLQGQKQILLPGQLAGACAVQIPQQLSALQTNMGRQIPSTSRPSGQAHTTTSQGPGARLSIYQVLPAHILSSQHVAGQLNLCHLLPSQSTPGTAHILWAPMQLQPSQVGHPAIFQVPVLLGGSLTTQSQASVAAPMGQTGMQGVPRGILLQQKQQPPTSQAPLRARHMQCHGLLRDGQQAGTGGGGHGNIRDPHAEPRAHCCPPTLLCRLWETSGAEAVLCVQEKGGGMPPVSAGSQDQGHPNVLLGHAQVLLYDSELHPKKASTLQPGKEACFLEQLHKHQAMVLHPDYRTPFRSLDDAVQRLLPYHIYQGTLPSDEECRKVDEEFEVVSAQLLKRSQAMLNKYRLLLLEESQIGNSLLCTETSWGNPEQRYLTTNPSAFSLAGISTSVPGDSRAFPSTSTLVSPGKGTAAQGRSGTAHARQQPVQYDSELHPKKASTLQPGKEACFLEQLHKHQAMVLHPDYRTPFRSLDDAVQRLLPYHIYQGTLPSDEECRKVDEEFEVVSAQLLKRSQAMLNKYRLLLLEESQVSPASCFPQGLEAQAFVQDRPLSWVEFPCCLEEDVSVLSPSHSLSSLASLASSSSAAPAPDSLKVPPAQAVPPTPSPKLEIKPSGSSPSVTCTKTSPLLDEDADTLPSGNKSPSQACGAPSQIGLKLKIKQRAGLCSPSPSFSTPTRTCRPPRPAPLSVLTRPPHPALSRGRSAARARLPAMGQRRPRARGSGAAAHAHSPQLRGSTSLAGRGGSLAEG
ncbi:BRD4-interacting chromatin-remodeling complex-associated protein-like [Cuculus canorus]|uniref:BRD4-interacting chromatin-remodeling complex-associated protein-like n=1 Tax=Cuculus canorus TaxID=55661 RepID=UPI0023AA8EE1|nr:BRD4-interacting chromatin-remodeling complex-associated protein-like [Cuculus canorus]